MPTEIKIDGGDDGNAQVIVTRVVSSGYFETVGTELIAGRGFQSTDIQKAPPVVIISQTMAKYYFKDQSPIGRTLGVAHGPATGRRPPRSSASPPTPTPTVSPKSRR